MQVFSKTNKNYGLALKGMCKYYEMKLVMLGIDQDRNLIIQFPVFIQPYTQKPLTLYQIETIPVLILDMNKRADSYTWIRIDKPIYCFKFGYLHIYKYRGIKNM